MIRQRALMFESPYDYIVSLLVLQNTCPAWIAAVTSPVHRYALSSYMGVSEK